MKYLLLGCTGMLGSAFVRSFPVKNQSSLFAPLRGVTPSELTVSSGINYLNDFELSEPNILSLLTDLKPDVVINCIGYIKQRQDNLNFATEMLWLNAYLPQLIAAWAKENRCKFITFSTDCVFDGRQGDYSEIDQPSPVDYYGVTKLAGEVNDGSALTIRTSIIGPEIRNKLSLLEWFMSKNGRVNGYTEAIYSGLPTRFLADFMFENIDKLIPLSGVYHLSSQKISKFKLLTLFNEQMSLGKEIISDCSVKIDRSLNSSLLQRILATSVPTWPELISILKADFNEL